MEGERERERVGGGGGGGERVHLYFSKQSRLLWAVRDQHGA